MLKNYLDERRRKWSKGELILPTSWAGSEARNVWNVLIGVFILRQNFYGLKDAYKGITIGLMITISGGVYYTDNKGLYSKLIERNIDEPGETMNIITQLAREDGIIVTRKDDQTVAVLAGNHLKFYEDRVVYEFTYTPSID